MATEVRPRPARVRMLIALLAVTVCLLFFQSWLALYLGQQLDNLAFGLNIARILTLPILVILALAIVGDWRDFLATRFPWRGLTSETIVYGIFIAILMRGAAWAQVVAAEYIGTPSDAASGGPFSLDFGWDCPGATVLSVAAVCWVVVVPVAEEILHRGAIQGVLADRGKWIAIVSTAAFFTLTHAPSDYAWVFVMGLLLGIQAWNSGTLWLPLITHAVYDGLHLPDTLCLRISGTLLAHPGHSSIIFFLAVCAAVAAVSAAFFLSICRSPGRREIRRPGTP